MPLNSNDSKQLNIFLIELFNNIKEKKWYETLKKTDQILQLLEDQLSEETYQDVKLKYYFLLVKTATLCALGRNSEAVGIYFKYVGIIFYAEMTAATPPMAYIGYEAKYKSLRDINPSLPVMSPDVCMNINQNFFTLRQELLSYWKKFIENNNNYFGGLTHDDLKVVSYLEYALAANDAYQRDNTTAISKLDNCVFNFSLTKQYVKDFNFEMKTLKEFGWELVLTAKNLAGYKKQEYFAKAYKNDAKKIIIIAHKGTDCAEDLITDWSIFRRQLPQKYYQSAVSFLNLVKRYLIDYSLNDYQIVMTGHSMGAALAELLTCAYNIPSITLDSPGVEEIVKEDNKIRQGKSPVLFTYTNFDTVPVIGVLTYHKNLVNAAGTHIGRLLKIPDVITVEDIIKNFKITTIEILSSIGKDIGIKTLRMLFELMAGVDAVDRLVPFFKKTYIEEIKTINSHTLAYCLKYLSKVPQNIMMRDSLDVIQEWPRGIQDGTTKPKSSRRRQPLIALRYFDNDMQSILKLAFYLKSLNLPLDFRSPQYNHFMKMLGAITITDKHGRPNQQGDHMLVCGKIAADEYRLYLWRYFNEPQHQKFRTFLLIEVNNEFSRLKAIKERQDYQRSFTKLFNDAMKVGGLTACSVGFIYGVVTVYTEKRIGNKVSTGIEAFILSGLIHGIINGIGASTAELLSRVTPNFNLSFFSQRTKENSLFLKIPLKTAVMSGLFVGTVWGVILKGSQIGNSSWSTALVLGFAASTASISSAMFSHLNVQKDSDIEQELSILSLRSFR